MRRFAKPALTLFLAALLLSGCDGLGMQETTEPTKVERISMTVDENTILDMERDYPDLKYADLSGSECYQAIAAYAARNPQVQVRYLVRLGAMAAAPDAQSLELEPGDYDYQTLLRNLAYLPQLQKVTLRNAALEPSELQTLRQAYPNVEFVSGLNFCGIPCDSETQTLDLSSLRPEQVLENAPTLAVLSNLAEIQLMAADGTTAFTLEQAAQLQAAMPQVLLRFSFDLFGKQVSTTDAEISYANQYIGNQPGALDTLRMALSVLRGCDRLVLDNCHFTNEELAQVRDEFRDTTKVVWRIWFGKGGCLTDRKVIRHVYNLYDSNSADLIYCEDAEFLDFGHNEILKQCDFVAGMPHLRAVILSGSMISDLTPFENCPDLEFLEVAYCGYLEDISPLAVCTNLQRLNIAYTKVSDLSPLDELNMQVMVDARSKTDEAERARFDDLHPDCLTQHTGDVKDDQPYGYPWRYDENGDPNEYYALLKEKFGYPNPTDTLY